VSFSRLVVNENTSDNLSVKSEKNWLAPIDKFNAIFSTSQTQFASLFPEHSEVNQSGLVQKPIDEEDYRKYIALYSEIKGRGNYSADSLFQLEALLTSSPYLYAAYALYRETASNLYLDSQNKKYFQKLDLLLKNSPPEYRYSMFEAIDRFWLATGTGNINNARLQIIEALKRGADDLTILQLEAFMFFKTGKYKEAAYSYSNAFKLRPSSSLLYNIAFSYWRMGDLDKSKSSLNRMLEIVPNSYIAKRLKANIWLLQGKLELAISAYIQVVSTKTSGRDLTNLSLAYGLNEQYEKSLKYAELAVNLDPLNTIRRSNLADIEFILGKTKSANRNYQRVIDAPLDKNKYRYWLDIAKAQLQLNEQKLAIEALNKAKHLAPDNGEVAYTSALIYSVLGEQVTAIFEVNKALVNNVGAVWFNLPWFDNLCPNKDFQHLMEKYKNSERCF
jgi:serine/threonine-protein kinase